MTFLIFFIYFKALTLTATARGSEPGRQRPQSRQN
jgi:hypothetical protein